jgi:hypothetical protein
MEVDEAQQQLQGGISGCPAAWALQAIHGASSDPAGSTAAAHPAAPHPHQQWKAAPLPPAAQYMQQQLHAAPHAGGSGTPAPAAAGGTPLGRPGGQEVLHAEQLVGPGGGAGRRALSTGAQLHHAQLPPRGGMGTGRRVQAITPSSGAPVAAPGAGAAGAAGALKGDGGSARLQNGGGHGQQVGGLWLSPDVCKQGDPLPCCRAVCLHVVCHAVACQWLTVAWQKQPTHRPLQAQPACSAMWHCACIVTNRDIVLTQPWPCLTLLQAASFRAMPSPHGSMPASVKQGLGCAPPHLLNTPPRADAGAGYDQGALDAAGLPVPGTTQGPASSTGGTAAAAAGGSGFPASAARRQASAAEAMLPGGPGPTAVLGVALARQQGSSAAAGEAAAAGGRAGDGGVPTAVPLTGALRSWATGQVGAAGCDPGCLLWPPMRCWFLGTAVDCVV